MTTGETLRAAAQRVRQGWCQNALSDDRGGVCVVGALNFVSRGSAEVVMSDEAVDCFRLLWRHLERHGYGSVLAWNNAPDQTQEEVALGLEHAADYWESQQTPAIVWTMREDVPA